MVENEEFISIKNCQSEEFAKFYKSENDIDLGKNSSARKLFSDPASEGVTMLEPKAKIKNEYYLPSSQERIRTGKIIIYLLRASN